MRTLIPTLRWRLRLGLSLTGLCPRSAFPGAVSLTHASRLFLALMLALSSGLPVGAVRADAPETLAPADLTKLEAAAVDLFDDARHSDWHKAEQHLRAIGVVAEPVITRLNAASAPLIKAIIRSARAVRDHDRAGAQHGANKIMEWAGQAEAAAHPGIPPQIARLAYLIREIQIETENALPTKLAKRVGEIRDGWNRLRPTLEARGDTATIQEGERLIQQLELARTPVEFAQVQTPLSKLIERVRNTFDSAGR